MDSLVRDSYLEWAVAESPPKNEQEGAASHVTCHRRQAAQALTHDYACAIDDVSIAAVNRAPHSHCLRVRVFTRRSRPQGYVPAGATQRGAKSSVHSSTDGKEHMMASPIQCIGPLRRTQRHTTAARQQNSCEQCKARTNRRPNTTARGKRPASSPSRIVRVHEPTHPTSTLIAGQR